MQFFPYTNYIIKTNLATDEIIRRLQNNIEPYIFFRFNFFDGKPTKQYEGKISKNSFSIQRIISGRNSFLPRINGEILKYPDHSEVCLTMRMAAYSYIVWFIIIGALLYALFIAIGSMISRQQFNPAIFILGLLIIAVYLFALLSFNSETSKSKKFFDNLFDNAASEYVSGL